VDLSVIIVNWNTRDDLARCLASLRPAAGHLALETVVVDNGSTDGSQRLVRREFPEVRLMPLGRNVGFAAGNNHALPRTTGRYRLLLNPDCIVHEGALEELVAYADAHRECGLLGPRLLNGDGSLQPSCRAFPTIGALLFRNTFLDRWWPHNPFGRGYLMDGWSHDRPRQVDWLSGACVLARAEVIEQVGGLDDRYYMYVEDMDWCRSVHQAGWQVVYLPTAVVTHLIGRASDQRPAAMIRQHHVSMVRYVAKHYGVAAAALAWPLIAARYLAIRGSAWLGR